jgi:schlafen family protein
MRFNADERLLDDHPANRARVLFSKQTVPDWMDAATQAGAASLERQPLFSKTYLGTQGIKETRETSQIANFTLVEWGEDARVAKKPPVEYVQLLKTPFSPKELERMHYWHALPDGWENMEYREFLQQRRELMAKVIRDAYLQLTGQGGEKLRLTDPVSPEEIIGDGETSFVEFKSTLRTNMHTRQEDPRMVLSVLKTLAAFVNSQGGTLLIGVADDGTLVGLGPDAFENEDRMSLHLVGLIKERMGVTHMMYIHPRFDDYQGGRVMAVECLPGRSPVFVKDGNAERFYVRTGPSTQELSGAKMQDFIQKRFKS